MDRWRCWIASVPFAAAAADVGALGVVGVIAVER